MRSIGLKAPGSYPKNNHHGGVMFALPGEFNLTGQQGGMILRHCFKSGRGTKSQLESVRKMGQLMTGGSNDSKVKNWKGVNDQWKVQDPAKYCDPTKSLVAKIIPL